MRRIAKGFTLIELMITVAIIGILGAIAYPSYTAYVVRAKRAECRTGILQVMQQQERFFTQRNAYMTFTSSTTGINMRQFSGDNLTNSACTIASTACIAGTATFALDNCVRVTTAPRYSDPAVTDIFMQSNGEKGCNGDQAKCWK